ncbi:MAG: hypothetical protein J0I32_23210 [Sphingobacteriales bacterium]|nr:hypothetical protein [Sphingobacteriales bacterium]OJW01950.1 MAG: hypothetical protein BGO52_00255 [Sphingobacteriales bacterium 44-61]
MRSTVLHANKKTAEQIAADLLGYTTPKGRSLFTRHPLPDGFEIRGIRQGTPTVVFRYTHEDDRHRFDYDEQLLTFL